MSFEKNIFPRIKENYPEISINIAGRESEKINELKLLTYNKSDSKVLKIS